LLYIGANQQGSRDAITHFLTDIWPMVRAGAPNTELNIVGPVGRTISKELITDGVNILGRVEHLTDFAGPDMIGLLPTQLMSGISIKVGEYLGMGVPIVAYPAGIDGYGAALSGIVQLADTPDRFAAQTLALLSDRDARRTISQAGLEAAETVLQNPDVVEALRGLRPD
jgi:glycosyltransferase involved in cell wall biosynthesis